MNPQIRSDKEVRAKAILVVDDDVETRHLLASALRAAAFVVHEAASADEALRLLESPLRFDAVITDVQMPGELDGIGLAEKVRARNPHLTIVVVSGATIPHALNASEIPFFHKPYSSERIIEHLNRALADP